MIKLRNIVIYSGVYFISLLPSQAQSAGSGEQPRLILPVGHTNGVNSGQFSPDGKEIVTTSYDQTAKLWDVASGKLLTDLKGHSSSVMSAQFSPDGKKIVTASHDNTAKIWDPVTGKLLTELKGHTNFVLSAYFSPDGKKIVTASFDSTAKIWDAVSGRLLNNLAGHKGKINAAVFSPDGLRIVTASYDGSAIIWDVKSGKRLFNLNKHSRIVFSAMFSPDGKKIVTAADDNSAIIWDAVSGKLLAELKGHQSRVSSANFSPDGKQIVTGSWDRTARIWDAGSGKLLKELSGHNDFITTARFSPDGKTIVTSSYDKSAKTWDVVSGKLLFELKGHKHLVGSAQFSPDGKKIITASYDGTAKIWSVTTGKKLVNIQGHSASVRSAEYSSDGKKILTISLDTTAKLWSAESGKLLVNLVGHKDLIFSAKFSPDQKKIITASWDSTAKIWDVNSGKLLTEIHANANISFAQFSPDGKKIVTASSYNGAVIWNADTGDSLNYLSDDKITSVQFSPDGHRIITMGTQGATTWDTDSGTMLGQIRGRLVIDEISPGGMTVFSDELNGTRIVSLLEIENNKLRVPLNTALLWVNSVHFSADQKKMLITHDSVARIYEVVSGKLLMELNGHHSLINSARFSPDGNKIVTASYDNTAKIWDASSGKLLSDLAGHNQFVSTAQFSPDGKNILTRSEDNTCKVWNATTGDLLYSFFIVDNYNYLVVDKENRYDGTEAARKLLYYTCNGEIIELDQFKDLSWEPELVSKIMGTNKEPITAKKLSEINICNFTPEVEEQGFNNGIYRYQVTPRSGGIGEVQLYINGKLVRKYLSSSLPMKDNAYQLMVNQDEIKDFFNSGSDNEIAVKATTKDGNMTSRGNLLTIESAKKAITNPNVYIVSIGISQYKGEKLKLAYASKDAIDFSSALTLPAKKLLNTDGKEHVTSYTFSTNEGYQNWPTKQAITRTMESIATNASADDILVVFFAGHGVLQSGKKNLYLLTAEATAFDLAGVEKEVSISFDELKSWMQKIRANKQLVILDACNSGEAVKSLQELFTRREVPADQVRALEDLKDKTGTFILSASASGQAAYETSLYGQGLLTYSLLSGIKLGAGLRDNKYIDVSKWFNAAADNVKVMAKEIGGRQDPQIIGNASFNVGLVDREVSDAIRLSIKKKVFKRSNFVMEGPMPSDYLLGLSALVDKSLNEVSSRGKESPLTFIADNTLAESYFIVGSYKATGNDVKVKVYLLKSTQEDKPLYEFEQTGSLDKKEKLATDIVESIQKFLDN